MGDFLDMFSSNVILHLLPGVGGVGGAQGAGIFLLISSLVNFADVTLQRGIMSRSPATPMATIFFYRAFIWKLSCMDPHVSPQICRAGANFLTAEVADVAFNLS